MTHKKSSSPKSRSPRTFDPIELCQQITDTTYYLRVLEEDELIATGTAIAFNKNGDLLTALHVITSRLPIKQSDLDTSKLIVLAQDKEGNIVQYYPVPHLYGIGLINELLRQTLYIDLAIIRSLEPRQNVTFLPISEKSNVAGTTVLMAGFSDDIELPFSFDRLLNIQHPELKLLTQNIQFMRRPLMIKSGMIGNATAFTFSNNVDTTISGDIIYIDNALHSGASGGPVVDMYGRIIGVITERAITRVSFEETPSLRVPSGSTVAIAPRCIIPFLIRENTAWSV